MAPCWSCGSCSYVLNTFHRLFVKTGPVFWLHLDFYSVDFFKRAPCVPGGQRVVGSRCVLKPPPPLPPDMEHQHLHWTTHTWMISLSEFWWLDGKHNNLPKALSTHDVTRRLCREHSSDWGSPEGMRRRLPEPFHVLLGPVQFGVQYQRQSLGSWQWEQWDMSSE